MINSKNLFLVFTLFGICHFGISQSKKSPENNKLRYSAVIQKMRIHLQSFHGLRGGEKPELFYNPIERILDLGEMKIPIENVKILYVFEEQTEEDLASYGKATPHFIKFSCVAANCFGENMRDVTSQTYPFKTKSACYQFIELIQELKNL